MSHVTEVKALTFKEEKLMGFVRNNLEGSRLEKMGQVNEAVKLYEKNIENKFDGDHPYERLRIIYSREDRNNDAIRVCQLYLQNVHQDPSRRAKYKDIILKLQDKKV